MHTIWYRRESNRRTRARGETDESEIQAAVEPRVRIAVEPLRACSLNLYLKLASRAFAQTRGTSSDCRVPATSHITIRCIAPGQARNFITLTATKLMTLAMP